MSEYTLYVKGRRILDGDFFTVLLEANVRGGIATVTPSQRGYLYRRILVDLEQGFEIREKS